MDVENDFAAQDLFSDDEAQRSDNDDGNRDGNISDEAIETPDPGAAQRKKVAGESKENEEQPKKRIIRNPQPKLDPDRICGTRGIGTLSDVVFKDFKAKGGDHVFEDLDHVMQKMEHWAHRLYPKLPCDDVMARISVLGKKMAVKTNVKKMRMGMEVVIAQPDKAVDNSDVENEEDTTKRYDNDEFPTEDEFDRIVREAEACDKIEPVNKTPQPKTVISDEQKERMERNKRLAEEKRRARQLEAAQKLSQEKPVENEPKEVNEDSDDEQITFINDKTDETPLSQVYEPARKSPTPIRNEIMDSEEMFA